MTGGIRAASRNRIADPAFSRAGFNARLAEAVANHDVAFAERDAIVADRD